MNKGSEGDVDVAEDVKREAVEGEDEAEEGEVGRELKEVCPKRQCGVLLSRARRTRGKVDVENIDRLLLPGYFRAQVDDV